MNDRNRSEELPRHPRPGDAGGGEPGVVWHQSTVAEAARRLQTELQRGLEPEEVRQRQLRYGPNELSDLGGRGSMTILVEQLKSPLVFLLIAAAALSVGLGEARDAWAIFAIVVLNSALGFAQDYRAEKAMAALRKLTVPEVHVWRGGCSQVVSARDLVPGDLLHIAVGDLLAADGRLTEAVDLKLEEAALTGESVAVRKQTAALEETSLALGDRSNLVFRGTAVAGGRGVALVTAIGMKTELGSIASLLQKVERSKPPLSRRLERLSRNLLFAALAVVAAVVIVGLLRGEELRLMVLTGLSLAVAAVPEGLLAVATVALAAGARRMLQRRALIRRLPAAETLGSITVICTDKTGTLTENRMSVAVVELADGPLDLSQEPSPDRPAGAWLLAAGALCNDAVIRGGVLQEDVIQEDGSSPKSSGDATEIALAEAADRWRLSRAHLEEILPRIAEKPFDADRKLMTTLHRRSGALPLGLVAPSSLPLPPDRTVIAFTKGAPEAVLERAKHVWEGAHIVPVNDLRRNLIEEAEGRLADRGMRVLGIAFRTFGNSEIGSEEPEEDLVFLGLVGIRDPLRSTVPSAVALCRRAGIRPIMITGDHPRTATAIAREAGIGDGALVTGSQLASMSPAELEEVVAKATIFARVSPKDKLEIVRALQRNGEVVAMTGDGVNDAPGLRRADIGIAMGITGTDVAKEAAEIILLDDDFGTIVGAVDEGRTIYDNIRRFVAYILASNAGEVLVMLLGPLAGLPLPLIPLQILWINLVTDGPPALALGLEPAEPGTMERPPRPPSEPLLGRSLGGAVLALGLLMAVLTLAASGALVEANDEPERWRTMVFTILTLSQLGNAIALRSFRESIFARGLFSNRLLLGAIVLTFFVQMAAIYLPALQAFLQTVPLSPLELAVCIGTSLLPLSAAEAFKGILRHRDRGF